MHLYEVLRRPIITEKSSLMQTAHKFVFEVAKGANKSQIKEAVQTAFNVTVLSVNVSRMPGKVRRVGRNMSHTPDWKKAVVTLRPGDTIEFFEGV